jgi:FkbM family methyltransferase
MFNHLMKCQPLNDTPARSFSQFGEDSLILKFFKGKADGFFVKVGANDLENLSQTFLLEHHGRQGILVEPLPNCCERLRSCRPRSQVFQVACGSPKQCGKAWLQVNDTGSKLVGSRPDTSPVTGYEEVRVMTLDEILKPAGNLKVDFLSIDVAGLKLEVLRGFDLEKHQPRLLLNEDNLPNA